MPRFDETSAIAALEVQQLIAEWGRELDVNGGSDVASLCTDDCAYHVGAARLTTHEAISGFYAARNERVRSQQRDGIRTQRHTISNMILRAGGADRMTAEFLLVNYSNEGPPPVLNLVGPTIVADCRMEFMRQADGEWRISLFDSTPVFIGNDPFLNAAVAKS